MGTELTVLHVLEAVLSHLGKEQDVYKRQIVGFITRGFGVSIHKQTCANAVASMKDPSNAPRWVKAYWADSVKDSYKAGLEIIALNRNELLQDVLSALADVYKRQPTTTCRGSRAKTPRPSAGISRVSCTP